jgi:hypothetical protein
MSFFERMDRKMTSMRTMMDKVGVNVDTFAMQRRGLDLAEAARACAFCGAAQTCAKWLERAPDHVDHAPSFCPNAARFERAQHG